MTGFALRPLGALDLDLVSRFHGDAFEPLGERRWTRQDIAGLLSTPGTSGLFLLEEDREIGMALFRVAADEAELLTIAVGSSHRRRGAGSRLVRAVVDQVRAAGALALFLEVGEDNPPARALYGRMGFETVGRRMAYYDRAGRPAADALVMRLVLGG